MLTRELKYFNGFFLVGLVIKLIISSKYGMPFLPEKKFNQDILNYLSEFIVFVIPYIISLVIRLCEFFLKELEFINKKDHNSTNVVITFFLLALLFYMNKCIYDLETEEKIREMESLGNFDYSFSLDANDARKDIANEEYLLYLDFPNWEKNTANNIASKYGFSIAWPVGSFMGIHVEDYNNIMIKFLEKKNGKDWYSRFVEEIKSNK